MRRKISGEIENSVDCLIEKGYSSSIISKRLGISQYSEEPKCDTHSLSKMLQKTIGWWTQCFFSTSAYEYACEER